MLSFLEQFFVAEHSQHDEDTPVDNADRGEDTPLENTEGAGDTPSGIFKSF